jgi:hypothetical protein
MATASANWLGADYLVSEVAGYARGVHAGDLAPNSLYEPGPVPQLLS